MKHISKNFLNLVGGLTVLVFFMVTNTFFTVSETEQALVNQFGRNVRAISTPGLHWKIPLLQETVMYEKRIQSVDPPAEEIILSDRKRLVVDTVTRYRIVDPLQFFQTVATVRTAEERLVGFIRSALRSVVAKVPQTEILSGKRVELMNRIRDNVQSQAKGIGIEIIDVRIRAADLPQSVLSDVYRRMESERRQEASLIRAEGEEKALKIRASADRERTIIISEAEREAQIIRGQGDATAIKTYADALQANPEFYKFYRSLDAYKKSLSGNNTTIILNPDHPFLKYLESAPTAN